MSIVINKPRIKLLSPELASQIAAGEVVERPASIVKELLENSIDAGSTQIEVHIINGGLQAIEIRDNGCGILPEDLNLALQQHATSKISSVQDLNKIISLGFRGEALASINSVAKVKIISNADQEAWSIEDNKLSIAARVRGTTVIVRDLFYNMPARRKFLRSERTEYQHLEEVFRRIALSNFAISFKLIHNGKLIKALPQCTTQIDRDRRIQSLCGRNILQQVKILDAEQNGMRLWGWLGDPATARNQELHQYFYINNRIIKDRLINHAMRTVFQPIFAAGYLPFYALYLEVDPVALDVNVHPTKHEVRFRDARIIHAFISQVLTAAISIEVDETSLQHKFMAKKNPEFKILSVLPNNILLAQLEEQVLLLDLAALKKLFYNVQDAQALVHKFFSLEAVQQRQVGRTFSWQALATLISDGDANEK